MNARIRVLRHVLRLAVGVDRRVVTTILGLVALGSGGLAAAAFSQRWLVESVGWHSLVWLVTAAVLGAVAHAVMAAGDRVRATLQMELSERVEIDLNQEILGLTAGIATLDHLERPDYLNRLSMLRNETRALAASCWVTAETVAAMVSLVLSVWLLVSVHPALSVLVLLTGVPLYFAYLGRRSVARSLVKIAEPVRQEQRLHELCVQPEPAKEVRISGAGLALSRRATDRWREVARIRVAGRLTAAGWRVIGSLCFVTGYLLAIGLVAHLVLTRQAGVGDVVLLLVLGSQLHNQIGAIVEGVVKLGEARHAMDQYLWLLEYAEQNRYSGTQPAPERLDSGVELRNVSFRYPNTDDDVLTDVSVRLPAGAAVAVVGVNGAGKTTLVKLLSGLYQPTAGQITVDGSPLSTLDVASWRARVSPAFQDFVKFQFPVRQSVGVGDLPRIDDDEAVRTAVRRANADPVVDGLADGLDTQLGLLFDGVELSHGQWQRLALARALARDTPLLVVLDEPTAALDPAAEQELFDRFIAQADQAAGERGAIRLIVSHRFSTVRSADLILVLADGGIAEQGSHAELIALGGHYADLYQIQAHAYA